MYVYEIEHKISIFKKTTLIIYAVVNTKYYLNVNVYCFNYLLGVLLLSDSRELN